MYLAIRTDNKQAEIYLLDQQGIIKKQELWDSARTLARDLPLKISNLLNNNYNQLSGIIAFEGPGSFTGLRIGITIANTISYSQNTPIVGASGGDWLAVGYKKLSDNKNGKIILPKYGREANITKSVK